MPLNKILNSFAFSIIRFRLLVIILSIFSLVYAWHISRDLVFNNSNEMWFLENDKTLLDYNNLLKLFGDDEFVVIGVENKNKSSVFQQETIETISKITVFLSDLDHVTKVQSLSKVETIAGAEDVITIEKLFSEFELTLEEYKAKERIAIADPLINGLLVTDDGKFSLIYARITHIEGSITHKVKLSKKIRAFLNNLSNKEKFNFYYAGGPALDEAFLSASNKDQSLLIPLVLAIIILVLLYSFRSITGILLPLIIIIGTWILVYGFMAIMSQEMNILNSIIPVIILAVGTADAVHLLVDYYHEIDMGRTSKKSAENTIINLFSPCFFTSITTSISFLAFTTSRIAPLRELGLQAAFGVFIAFVLSITLLPALLSYMKPKALKAKKITQKNVFYNMFIKIAEFTPEQNKKILLTCGILTIVFICFTSRIKVDANAMNYFKDDMAVKIHTQYIDSKLKGTLNAEFIIDSGSDGGVKEPKFLLNLEKLQNYLESVPEFGRVNSMLDYLKKMNQVMHNDDKGYYKIPDSREETAQYLLLYSLASPDEDLSDMIDFKNRYARMSVRIPIMNTSKNKELMRKVKVFLDGQFPALSVKLSGLVIIFNNIDEYILDSQISSFSLAFVLVFIMMIIVFRSFKFGALSMIPNILPVLAAGGIMGLFGINLEFGTVMVACVVIGIGVDDTIHYIGRYLRKRRQNFSKRESIQTALKEAGKPIIFTSTILFFGFFVLLFASLTINIYFGLLVCIAVLVALLADLFYLSAIILSLPEKN